MQELLFETRAPGQPLPLATRRLALTLLVPLVPFLSSLRFTRMSRESEEPPRKKGCEKAFLAEGGG